MADNVTEYRGKDSGGSAEVTQSVIEIPESFAAVNNGNNQNHSTTEQTSNTHSNNLNEEVIGDV